MYQLMEWAGAGWEYLRDSQGEVRQFSKVEAIEILKKDWNSSEYLVYLEGSFVRGSDLFFDPEFVEKGEFDAKL